MIRRHSRGFEQLLATIGNSRLARETDETPGGFGGANGKRVTVRFWSDGEKSDLMMEFRMHTGNSASGVYLQCAINARELLGHLVAVRTSTQSDSPISQWVHQHRS